VSANGKQIYLEIIDMQRIMSCPLNSVRVERDPLFSAMCTDLQDGIDGADFVVGVHDRDDSCVRVKTFGHVFWMDHALLVDRDGFHLESEDVL
jgi:hypothetical protein